MYISCNHFNRILSSQSCFNLLSHSFLRTQKKPYVSLPIQLITTHALIRCRRLFIVDHESFFFRNLLCMCIPQSQSKYLMWLKSNGHTMMQKEKWMKKIRSQPIVRFNGIVDHLDEASYCTQFVGWNTLLFITFFYFIVDFVDCCHSPQCKQDTDWFVH